MEWEGLMEHDKPFRFFRLFALLTILSLLAGGRAVGGYKCWGFG
jgi:hypothetical protein